MATATLCEGATSMRDLFGSLPAHLKGQRKGPAPKGHARPPGTGPKNETCGSCGNVVFKQLGGRKRVFKCGLNQGCWTAGRGSDVRLCDPACEWWSAEASMFNPKETRL